jgi:hypothetical protein
MCLLVKRATNRKKPLKCFKALRIYTFGSRIVTPVMAQPVTNGEILPINKSKRKKFNKNMVIRGGFIHAHVKQGRGYRENCLSTIKYFKAIAYGVKAYGNRDDLICEKLVIPELVPKKRTR